MKMETETALKEIRDLLSYGDVEAAVSLLQENDIDLDYRDVTHDLQTLLMRICYCKLSYTDLEHVLAAIFDKAPDVNVQDSWGRTVLMHACIANKPILIEGLLDYEETDVTIADFDGNNALSYAVQNCDIHSMEDILSHRDGGLLVSKHNAKGQSPLTIAQKSGDKSVIHLLESYNNKSVCLQDKKKQRKPRNRDIRLPLAYSPSPERRAQYSSPRHVTNRSIVNITNSSSLPNTPIGRGESLLSPRRNGKLGLDLVKSGNDLYSKSGSAPLLRKNISLDQDDEHNLTLTSARMSRQNFKHDSLTNYSCSLESPSTLPYLKINGHNSVDIPDSHIRRQRRPSISLPDLRIAGSINLVQSGGSTPTSEPDYKIKELGEDEIIDTDDDVFSQSFPNRQLHNSFNTLKPPEKQLTLPEINQSRSCHQSPNITRKNISPLARSRKYSNSDDHINRVAVSQRST